jgi:16S rRNA (uracil1498-N3)-methyltransferase
MSKRYFAGKPIDLGPFLLEGPEAHHLSHVSRLKQGEIITLFNGDGHEYSARIEAVQRQKVELEIVAKKSISREAQRQVTVASPLPKGDRGGFLVEKLTELGVVRYIPLRSERSVVHPSEGKTDKLKRAVIEASKQCGRNVLMQIDEMTTWAELVTQNGLPHEKLFADALGTPIGMSQTSEVIVAVGPEGGWSEMEADLGMAAGWKMVSLGKSILRIETAAIVAAVCLMR